MNASLITSIARGVWCIHPEIAQTFYPALRATLAGTAIEVMENAEAKPTFINKGSTVPMAMSGASKPSAGAVAVIPIKNVIFKYDQSCGPAGTETIAQWIQNADQNPNISGIVLDIDSPGGEGRAINNIFQAIQNAEKPVIAQISSGMAASAAYGIASACDSIYCSYSTDVVGSIGTYITLMDFYSYYEKEGLPVHEVYATKSEAKNLSFKKALEGNYDKLRAEIDIYNEAFIGLVKQGRPDINETVFDGRAPFADEALNLGLIDGIQSLSETILEIYDLQEQRAEASRASQTDKLANAGIGKTTMVDAANISIHKEKINNDNMELTAISLVLNALAGATEVSAEQIEAAQNEYTTLTETVGNTLITQAELEAAQSDVPKETMTEIEGLRAEILALEEQSAGAGKGVPSGGGAEAGAGNAGSVDWSEIDDLPHNQFADEQL